MLKKQKAAERAFCRVPRRREDMVLGHSTVTLLARLRGLSTSRPLPTAT